MKLVKAISILIAMLLVVSVFSAVFVNVGLSSEPTAEDTPKAIDVDTISPKVVGAEPLGEAEPAHHSYWNLSQSAIWSIYYSVYGTEGIVFTYFTLSYIGASVEIWVQNSIKFPSGDPRNGPGNNPGPTKPTYVMLQYLADQYEQNILPKESQFFGAPLYHNGSNAHVPLDYPYFPGMTTDYYVEPSGRAVILVGNIRDENYYDYTYPYYVIGVHIGAYEDYYYDRNIVTLDAVSWFHGLGPASMNWGDHYYWPTNIFHNHNVLSPYAYDSTLAHEFQHLLHHELCPGDATFMNEGCSMFAEMLCGYGLDPQYPNSYFATPDNSLTIWGDQGAINILADYGAAALWTIYLSDQFGSSFISYYFQHGGGGVDGITNALKNLHYHETFDTVYHDWRLANLIRQDFGCFKKYNYKSLNLNDPVFIPVRQYAIGGLPVPWTKGTDFGNTTTILGYDTGVSRLSPYGTDYIRFENWTKPGLIYFDGDDTAQLGWSMTADGWWSGFGNMLNVQLISQAVTVTSANPTLTLVTKYGIETNWDFGFVQVSTDSGQTWTSLANPHTNSSYHTDVQAIINNLPGFTGFSTGWPGWTTETFDLSVYVGQTVMINFRYMTDESVNYEGWFINSANVSGTALTLAPYPPYPKASFQVTTVCAIVCDGKTFFVPFDMWLTYTTQMGMSVGFAKSPSYIVMVVSPTMHEGTVDYKFRATPLFIRICDRLVGSEDN